MNNFNPMLDYQRNQLMAQQAMIQNQLNQMNQMQYKVSMKLRAKKVIKSQ